jgi:hypothetical protein
MRHIRNSLLRIINRLNDICRQLLQPVRHAVFFRRCFTGRSARFGVGGDVAVGVEATDRAVAFAQDFGAVFDEGFDLVDEGFFV